MHNKLSTQIDDNNTHTHVLPTRALRYKAFQV